MRALFFKAVAAMLFSGISFRAVADMELKVNWDNQQKTAVRVLVTKHDTRINECQQSGAEVHYRYESELCIRRRTWGDNCGKTMINTRTMSVDPISETYVVISDRLGDEFPAEKHSYGTYAEALFALSRINDVPVNLNEREKRRQYLNVRVRFICKGQSSALLTRLSQIITLGIAPAEGIDSGWQEFDFPKL